MYTRLNKKKDKYHVDLRVATIFDLQARFVACLVVHIYKLAAKIVVPFRHLRSAETLASLIQRQ